MGCSSKVFFSTNPNLWIGRPASAQNVVPLSPCHLPYGPGQLRVVGGHINNAASASAVGLGVVMADSEWVFGTWTTATSTFTADTANAQGGVSDAVVLATTTTNNGFIIGAKQAFNMFSLDITTADGGSPVYDVAYWGYPTTGSTASAATWQTVATNLIAGVLTSTGEAIWVVDVPSRVMVATTATVKPTGAPNGYYLIRVRATTAATSTAAKLARVYAGVELIRQSQLAQHAILNLAGGLGASSRTLTVTNGIMLGAFFGTANANNNLYLEYE